jgi:hypothetical protein
MIDAGTRQAGIAVDHVTAVQVEEPHMSSAPAPAICFVLADDFAEILHHARAAPDRGRRKHAAAVNP